jgi:Ca2+/Na+ antiporter
MNKPSRKRKLVDRYSLWDSLRKRLNYAILPFFIGLTVLLTLIILQAGISNVTGLEIYLFLVCLTIVLLFVRRYVNRKYYEVERQLEHLIGSSKGKEQTARKRRRSIKVSKPWRKLSFQEIAHLVKSHKLSVLFSSVEHALQDADKKFFVQVTRTSNPQADFTLWISGAVSIDLVEESDQKLPSSIAIAPAPSLKETTRNNDSRVFFVPLSTYEQFRREAKEIYTEYCQEGWNFGFIPHTWFSDLKLIQFIADTVWKHSYFQSLISSGEIEMSVVWTQEGGKRVEKIDRFQDPSGNRGRD